MGIDPLTESLKKHTSIKPKNKGFRSRVDLGFSKIIKQSLLVTMTNINIARIVTKSDKGLTRQGRNLVEKIRSRVNFGKKVEEKQESKGECRHGEGEEMREKEGKNEE